MVSARVQEILWAEAARMLSCDSESATPAEFRHYPSTILSTLATGNAEMVERTTQEYCYRMSSAGVNADSALQMVLAPFESALRAVLAAREDLPVGELDAAVQILMDRQRRAILSAGRVFRLGLKPGTDADQAAPAPESESNQALLAQVAQLAALQKVNSAANSSLDLDSVLELTVDAVAEVTQVDVCSIFLYEDATGDLVLYATKGLNPAAIRHARFKVGVGIAGSSALEGRPIAARDAWADPRFAPIPELHEESLKSLLAVPIVLFTLNKLIGVLTLYTHSYRDFREEEIRFVETVAGQIAIAIENARMYERVDEKLRQKVQELSTLQRVSSLIASTLDLPQVLDLIAGLVMDLTAADMSAIFRLDEGSQELVIVAARGLSDEYIRSTRMKLGQGALGKAVAAGAPVVVNNVLEDAEFVRVSPLAVQGGYRSLCSVPLISKDKTIGGISVYRREHREFTLEQVQLLRAFANHAAIAIENARLYEEAKRALAIKSALLQEMHHRVKNNLQTVAALLSLQLRRTQSASAAQPLGESIARIKSITAVHDLLAADQAEAIRVGDLAKQIVENANINLVPQGTRIQFELAGCEVELTSKEATIIALLMNELVANAIFHGLSNRRTGSIFIGASANDGEITIQVKDDGCGLPESFDLATDCGLGLQIVQNLIVNDLRGRFAIRSVDGSTVATISFRRLENEPLTWTARN